jgi:hypothetical protein
VSTNVPNGVEFKVKEDGDETKILAPSWHPISPGFLGEIRVESNQEFIASVCHTIGPPLPGVDMWYDIRTNAPLTAGAVWAVLILLLFVLLSKPRQRTLQVISAMFVICLPLSIINAGVWAITLYIFVVLYQVIASVFRLFE